LRKEAESKSVNSQKISYNISAYSEESRKEIEACSKKDKKPTKEEITQQEEAINLSISGKDIIASYEYASIIAYLAQFYDSNVMPIPYPEDNKRVPEIITKNENYIDIYGSKKISLNGMTLFKRTDYFLRNKVPNLNSKHLIMKKLIIEKEAGKLRELKWERIMKKRLKQFFIKKENNNFEDNFNTRVSNFHINPNSLNSSSIKDLRIQNTNVLERFKSINQIFSQNVQFFNEPDAEISRLKSDHSQLFEDIKFITKRKR